MIPLGSNQNNPLDDAVHIDTQFIVGVGGDIDQSILASFAGLTK